MQAANFHEAKMMFIELTNLCAVTGCQLPMNPDAPTFDIWEIPDTWEARDIINRFRVKFEEYRINDGKPWDAYSECCIEHRYLIAIVKIGWKKGTGVFRISYRSNF